MIRMLLSGSIYCLRLLVSLVLIPFEIIYGCIVVLRPKKARERVNTAAVISIGNITTGGTGKTPHTIMLAHQLKKQYRTAIISRGYRGNYTEDARIVSDGKNITATAEEVGDEPVMMARTAGVPIIVGRKRIHAAQCAQKTFQSQVLLLDDGFQHTRLYRDVNIALVDAMNPFGNGCLLPRGILREPLRALSRADAIIITKSNLVSDEELCMVSDTCRQFNAPLYYSELHSTHITYGKKRIARSAIKNSAVLLLSSIGNPLSFRRIFMKECYTGMTLTEMTFPDHYHFSLRDSEAITAAAAGKIIITTAKDAERLAPFALPLYVLHITVVLPSIHDLMRRLHRACKIKIINGS